MLFSARTMVFVLAGFALISNSAWGLSNLADNPPNIPRADNGYVWAIAHGASHIYVGGTFTTIQNGTVRAALAAYDAKTGALDTVWDPGLADSVSTEVQAIVVDNGRVYVAGRFETVRGGLYTRNNVVVFSEANGSSPATVDPWNPNVDNIVYALEVTADKVYIGGAFETVLGGTTRDAAAAFNKANGSVAASLDVWNPRLRNTPMWNPYPCINTIEVDGSRVYLGGSFDRVNTSVVRNNLAAFQLANGSNTGTVDAQWNPNLDDEVYSLSIANGKVYAGGYFHSTNGGTKIRNYAAAFNTAGTGDTGTADVWDPNPSSYVWRVMAAQGLVFLGGSFTTVNGGTATRQYIAAFNQADGVSAAVADAWNPGSSSTSIVTAFAPSGNVGILTGGSFTYIGSSTRYRIAGFNSTWDPAPLILSKMPVADSIIGADSIPLDLIFNEPVYNLDATDIVLSGPAAASAVVGAPYLDNNNFYRMAYRVPLYGLSDGALTVSIAPDAGDVVDAGGWDLTPRPTTWSYTVDTSGVASVPFYDGFETGALASCWDARGTMFFNNQVTTANTPHTGNYHFTMDSSLTGTLARNELTLTIDLAGLSDVELSFWMKEYGDEDHAPFFSSFTGGANFDGIAISADGVTWYVVQGLCTADGISADYTQFVINLDAAAASFGLNYNSTFRIRFNHLDDYYIPTDGFAFDDIRVQVAAHTPTITSVSSPHADGTFPAGEIIDVDVQFSNPVHVTGAPTLVLETGAADQEAVLTGGNDTGTLTFRYTAQPGDATPDLDATGTDALHLNGGSIRDAATETLDADLTLPAPGALGSLSANNDIAINTTSPSVSTVEVQTGLIVNVTYNQAMGASALNANHYSVSGSGMGTLIAHPALAENLGGNVYRLTWNTGEMQGGGDITIEVTNVFDAIGNPIGASNTATDAGGAIGDPPNVSTVEVEDGQHVLVAFDEPMGTGVETASYYTVSGTGQGTLAAHPDAIALVSGSLYRLTWNTGEMRQGGDITITVSDAVDLAGNPVEDGSNATDVGGGVGVSPFVTAVAVSGALTIDVTFSEPMGASATLAAHYTLSGAGGGTLALQPGNATWVSGNQYQLSWPGGEMLEGGDVTITVSGALDLAGNPIGDPDSATHIGGGSGVPPEVDTVSVNDERSVMVIFNEVMGEGALTPANYTLSGSGMGTLSANPDTVEVNEFLMYTLTWDAGEMHDGGDITITVNNVRDAVGNLIGTANVATETGTAIGFAPRLLTADVKGAHIIQVTFDEAVENASAMLAAHYTVSGPGRGTLAAQPVSVTADSSMVYTLTWTMSEMRNASDITITATEITDLAGNLIGSNNHATDPQGGIGASPIAHLVIEQDALYTRTEEVTLDFLNLNGTGSEIQNMRLRNGFGEWSSWMVFSATTPWQLEPGEGPKQVQAEIEDAAGNISTVVIEDAIILDTHPLTLSPVGSPNITARENGVCVFQVEASGVYGEPHYQWRRWDGTQWTDLGKDGVNSPLFTLDPVLESSEGTYACFVTDETESAGPLAFNLEVIPNVPVAGPMGFGLTAMVLALAAVRRFTRRL